MGLSLKRLESNALRELSILLRTDAKNNKLSNITVTECRITNDLSYMTVYYTFYGGKKETYEKTLEECKGYLRRELAHKLNARKMPELIFKYDESLENGNHIAHLLSQIREEEKAKEEARAETENASEEAK